MKKRIISLLLAAHDPSGKHKPPDLLHGYERCVLDLPEYDKYGKK